MAVLQVPKELHDELNIWRKKLSDKAEKIRKKREKKEKSISQNAENIRV